MKSTTTMAILIFLLVGGGIEAQSVDPDSIITVQLKSRSYLEGDYEDHILLDIVLIPEGMDKSARAVKGIVRFQDLVGELKQRGKDGYERQNRKNEVAKKYLAKPCVWSLDHARRFWP